MVKMLSSYKVNFQKPFSKSVFAALIISELFALSEEKN